MVHSLIPAGSQDDSTAPSTPATASRDLRPFFHTETLPGTMCTRLPARHRADISAVVEHAGGRGVMLGV